MPKVFIDGNFTIHFLDPFFGDSRLIDNFKRHLKPDGSKTHIKIWNNSKRAEIPRRTTDRQTSKDAI